MIPNWYVIQVRIRKEEEIAEVCKRWISKEILIDCFIPRYKKMRKYKGTWHQEEDILFKGYVFLISEKVDKLFQELKKIPDLTKLLGQKGTDICELREEEVQFLKSFSKNYVVEVSQGYIEGDTIVISHGPLVGHEGMIKRVDRHKRMAIVEVTLFDQVVSIKVGLEIINKR